MKNKSINDIKIAFFLNIFFSIFELVGGILTNSISIITDSVHDFGDAISIGIAVILEKKSKQNPNKEYTYGYLRYSLFGAIITSIILLMGSIFVFANAIPRIINPVEVNYEGMFILAIVGVIVNGYASYTTSKTHNINEKAVSLHMLEDVLGWVGVLICSIVIKFTGFYIIDPILSIVIALYILIHVVEHLKKIFEILLEKKPDNIDEDKIKEKILKLNNIIDIHHIHMWSMDGINNYATLHITINDVSKEEIIKLKEEIRQVLEQDNIYHVTIETDYLNCCHDKKCHIKHEFNEHKH